MIGLINTVNRVVIKHTFKSFSTKPGLSTELSSILSTVYIEEMEKLGKRYNSRDKTRYNGRVKKRRWEDDLRNKEENIEKSEAFERIKRKKSVIFLSYLGAGYHGMQRNPGMKTIEEDLLSALHKTNHITEEGYKQNQQIQFQRAARTDKGVSAAMQIVSLKLPDAVDIEQINNNLPPEIRVFDIKRVTKGFNSKSQCDARTYTYLAPSYAFEEHTKSVEDHLAYRISNEKINFVNSVLEKFLGTKNFHNFTSKKKYIDPSSRRYIMSFTCSEPFIMDDMEYVVLKVKGQSFMLHQIRKMVGITIGIVKGYAPISLVDKTWSPEGYDIPTAPGLGLVLDEIHYDRYNKRYGSDGIHEALTWENIQDKVDTFKKNVIYKNIAKQEKEEMGMAAWLETLPLHSFDVRSDFKPDEDCENDEESDGDDSDGEMDRDTNKTEQIVETTDDKCENGDSQQIEKKE